MAYTATVASSPEVTNEYELFTTETAEDVDGNEVTIKKSVGRVRKDQLTSRKEGLQAQIAEIDKKIKAIDAVTK